MTKCDDKLELELERTVTVLRKALHHASNDLFDNNMPKGGVTKKHPALLHIYIHNALKELKPWNTKK